VTFGSFAMIYEIKNWFWNDFNRPYRFFSRTRHLDITYPPSPSERDRVAQSACELSCQSMHWRVLHAFAVSYPYDPASPLGEAATARCNGYLNGQGKRSDYSGTGYLPDDTHLYIRKLTTRGRCGREMAPYALTHDDVYTVDSGKLALRGVGANRIGLVNIEQRIKQCVSEWGINEYVPQSFPGSSAFIWSPVESYQLAGVSVMRARRQVNERKSNVGKQGKDLVGEYCRYALNCAQWLEVIITTRWDQQVFQNVIFQQILNADAIIGKSIALCQWFHTEPQQTIWPSAWQPRDYDPLFEYCAGASKAHIKMHRDIRTELEQLYYKNNPPAHGADFYGHAMKYQSIMFDIHLMLTLHLTGHTQPIQTQHIACE
jgi:hypothetical protein